MRTVTEEKILPHINYISQNIKLAPCYNKLHVPKWINGIKILLQNPTHYICFDFILIIWYGSSIDFYRYTSPRSWRHKGACRSTVAFVMETKGRGLFNGSFVDDVRKSMAVLWIRAFSSKALILFCLYLFLPALILFHQ